MTSLRKSASAGDYRGMQYQMDGALDPRPKRGPDVKIIIQSLKLLPLMEQPNRAVACNPAKMFKSSIQHANDSGSMDTSLEYKPFPTASTVANQRKVAFMDELRVILKENQNVQTKKPNGNGTTPSKLAFANRKNLPKISETNQSTPTICEKYIDVLPLLPMDKKMPASSTPYRPKADSELNNNCTRELNLMTPKTDVRLADADDEPLPSLGDFNRTLVKCFSLTRASCRRMASFRKALRKQECNSEILSPNESPTFQRRSLFTSSLRTNRTSIVSTDEESPLRRQKNIKLKNSKLLNFFRSTKEPSPVKRESDLTQTCNNLSRLLEKSNQSFDDLGCVPLLTKDNIEVHANSYEDGDKTIGWGDKFEFSFICEPSTSDCGEDIAEMDYFPSTNCRKKLPIIPFVKVSPPSIESNKDDIQLRCNDLNVNASPFRRSVSDPALIRLATNNFNVDPIHTADTNAPTHYLNHNNSNANTVSALNKNYTLSSQLPSVGFIFGRKLFNFQ